MKMFFSMFAAILCAAAVIWGVMAHNQAREKERQDILKLLKLSTAVSNHFPDSVIKEEWPQYLMPERLPEDIASLTNTVNKGLLSQSELSSPVFNIVYNYRMFVDWAEKKYPDKKGWVAEARKSLDALESASKSASLSP